MKLIESIWVCLGKVQRKVVSQFRFIKYYEYLGEGGRCLQSFLIGFRVLEIFGGYFVCFDSFLILNKDQVVFFVLLILSFFK